MWIRAIAVIAACALSGCAGISGSSSMRVEVEVYKGPLSLEPAAQWGELRGLLEQGALAFRAAHQRYLLFAKDELDREGVRSDWVFEGRSEEWHEKSVARTRALGEADMARQRQHVVEQTSWLRRLLGWTTGDSEAKYLAKYQNITANKEGALIAAEAALEKPETANPRPLDQECYRLLVPAGGEGVRKREALKLCSATYELHGATLASAAISLLRLEEARNCDDMLEELPEGAKAEEIRHCYRNVLRDVSAFSAMLRTLGFVSAFNHVGFASKSRLLRGLQVGAANLASQLANELEARSDALLKQMRGDESAALPLSVYLRNASETDFLNLYVWNHAAAPSLCEEGCNTEDAARERTRVVERLFADNNWSKVNSVYASGQGEVRMVFVKDDIGNWNLKGFDNDPEELLEAYKAAGIAAVKTVAKLASSGGAQGLIDAQTALQQANSIALGRTSKSQDSSDPKAIRVLRQRTEEKLQALRETFSTRLTNLGTELDRLDGEIGEAESAREEEQAQLERAQAAFTEALVGFEGTPPPVGATPEEIDLRVALEAAGQRDAEAQTKTLDDALRDVALEASANQDPDRGLVLQGQTEALESLRAGAGAKSLAHENNRGLLLSAREHSVSGVTRAEAVQAATETAARLTQAQTVARNARDTLAVNARDDALAVLTEYDRTLSEFEAVLFSE